jgi:DNA repair exonuclease SbcCD ATPase subunit
MTKRQFIIADFLNKIGIQRKRKRLLDAANELNLLREAVEILGRSVWINVKDIDPYKVNYERIHKLLQEKDEVNQKIQKTRERIEILKQNQESEFKEINSHEQNIEELYKEQKSVVEKIKAEQSDIIDIVSNIKKNFDDSVTKLQQIIREGSDEAVIEAGKAKVEQLRNRFAELKNKKIISDRKLAKETDFLTKMSSSVQSSNSKVDYKTINDYGIVAEANREMAGYHSEIGVFENELITHYNKIGQMISKECFSNSQCRKAVGSKFKLCKIIKSLAQSIDFNHSIADR